MKRRQEDRFVDGPFRGPQGEHAGSLPSGRGKYFGFHALRHFGASGLDKVQVPIGSIERILGHENRTTTEIYLHSIGEAEREAMAVFERACQETPPEKSHTQIHTQQKNGVSRFG